MAADEIGPNYAALAALYEEWMRGELRRLALIAGGVVRGYHDTPAAARDAVRALPGAVTHALVATLWPLDGWRHPRFVVDSYLRADSPVPAPMQASDPLARDFLLAEQLRHAATDADMAAPYLLIKDGAVLGRYERVTRARQAVAAAQPPLAPVVFTSLRPGRAGPFSLMTLQALMDTESFHSW